MALYMDIHRNIDASAADVAAAHEKDLAVQDEYGADFTDYWVDEDEGTVFCLFEAPDAETGERVHREAHGLVADEIHEVMVGE
ncbi:MAG: nickel-binding protein [Haloarculaceae archaeon]